MRLVELGLRQMAGGVAGGLGVINAVDLRLLARKLARGVPLEAMDHPAGLARRGQLPGVSARSPQEANGRR